MAAPTNLEATGGSTAIGLSWELVPGATAYDLYWSLARGVTLGDGIAILDVAPGYVHRSLSDGAPYHYVVVARGPAGSSPPSLEATATPGGEFELIRYGTGVIDSVVTPAQISIPVERRVHVLVLAEGYLATDIAAGTFATDVDNWTDQIRTLDPFSRFIEAFVIWALPRASVERVSVSDPQTSDTAFRVPVIASGLSGILPSSGPTAVRVWSAADASPVPPSAFYAVTGRTSGLAKNVVVHILVLNPATGRSGLSGQAFYPRNPSNTDDRLSVALGHGRDHLFALVFGRLVNEHIDVDFTSHGADPALANQSAEVANVVTEATCAVLPWRHLLLGGASNPGTANLVGAFGTPTSGYHSEFKCMMNGTHDNALVYGGDGRLRPANRFCNYCRELTTLRLFERVGVLDDSAVSLDGWVSAYREPFYRRFGFLVPAEVPQQSSDGTPWFSACTP